MSAATGSGNEAFEGLLAKQNVRVDDVQPRGPFGNRVQTMFTLMSNQMAQNRDQACIAVAGEYGPEGAITKNVLLPAGPTTGAPAQTEPASPRSDRSAHAPRDRRHPALGQPAIGAARTGRSPGNPGRG